LNIPGRVLNIGHRGFRNRFPENTEAGFEGAIAVGVDMIEADLQVTRDGHLVVHHDYTLGRTTNGRGLVRRKDLAYIATLDAGSWFAPEFAGQRVLRLEELLELASGRVGLMLHVKKLRSHIETAGRNLARASASFKGALVIASTNPGFLQWFGIRYPEYARCYIATKPDIVRKARKLGVQIISCTRRLLTRKLVKKAAAADLPVLAWTASKPDHFERMLRKNVAGIVNDAPDMFQQALSRWRDKSETRQESFRRRRRRG